MRKYLPTWQQVFKTVAVVNVFVLAIVIGLVAASFSAPRWEYPTPAPPPHITMATWTPAAVALDNFIIPPLSATAINSSASISSIEAPPNDSVESGIINKPNDVSVSDSVGVVDFGPSDSAGSPPISIVPTLPNDESPGWSTAPTPTSSAQETIPAPTVTFPPPVETVAPGGSALKAPSIGAMGTPSIGPAPTWTPTPTDTPVPPTLTPTPTATPEPTATPAGNYNKCPIDGHNLVMMHSHYNAANDCWYDHTHTNGPVPSDEFIAFTGQQLSYPWLTGNGAENLMWPNGKHEGYNFSSRDAGYMDCNNPPFCIDSYEIEWHGMPNNHGFAHRFHSFAALLTIGDGFIFYGGWQDCGQRVQIGNDWYTIDESRPQPGGTALKHATFDTNGSETWYCTFSDVGMENLIGQQYAPSISRTTPDNLFSELDPLCLDDSADCLNRGHDRWISAILIDLSSPWARGWADEDGDGVANWSGYTDRYGVKRAEGECTEIGLDCVPLVVSNVPVGRYDMTTNPTGSEPFTPFPERINWWNR